MAVNYSANQYEREFTASRLGNWMIPKEHTHRRPAQRKNVTTVISNDRGHLLPSVVRPKTSPWGNFKGTWQIEERPRRIQCNQAENTEQQPSNLTNKYNKILPELNQEAEVNNNNNKPNLEYRPGELVPLVQTHHSRQILIQPAVSPRLNHLYTENHKCTEEKLATPTISNIEEAIQKTPADLDDFREQSEKEYHNMRIDVTDKPGENNTVPLVPAYCNFQMAKKMAQENLEHQPLPDSIMDKAFRKMQAQGCLNPEIALDVEPIVTGVGIKTCNAGPTHCTKLKVYRPKTCGIVPRPLDREKLDVNIQSTHFSHRDKIKPMDLAICWDYRPINPSDEPKPPVHIDGSNGSAAPAVFTLVKTPRPAEEQATGRSGGVFANTIGEEGFFDKDIMLRNKNYFSAKLEKNTDRTCRCGQANKTCRSLSASRNIAIEDLRCNSRSKSSPNLSVIAQASDHQSTNDQIIVCNYNREHYHYRPETCRQHHVTHHGKHAFKQQPCDNKHQHCGRMKSQHATDRLSERNVQHLSRSYQQDVKKKCPHQFKSKAVRSNSSGFCSSFENSSNNSSLVATEFTSKIIRIPKPRNPYAKRNYVIDTLAPPFACWKGGAGQGGYPEHWRLASVYQHAYKPVEQRRQPLLATVYK